MAKVLVVEDEDSLREVYTKMMADDGLEVDSAPDGEQALSKIKASIPEVILLDLIMPKMNGFEVLQKIRSDEATKHIKVIVLTNIYADQMELVQAGADKVLMKTDYNPGQVLQIVKDTLQAPTAVL